MEKITLGPEDTILSIEHYIVVRESGLTMQQIQKSFHLSETNALMFELGYQCHLKNLSLDKALFFINSAERILNWLDKFEAETKNLPLGIESQEKGASEYNWRMWFIRQARAALDGDANGVR